MSAPDLNLLIALDMLLEEGSVAGAARRMHLSAPAMSRTLARIRATVGDPVFVQAGRKLVPTPRALALREQVRAALEQATQVLLPGTEVDLKTVSKRFSVRANDIFVGVHGGRLLELMAHDMPRAVLRFAPEEDDIDDEALRTGRIDLFISAARQLGPEIRVQSLFSTNAVGVARAGHPLFDEEISAERMCRWGHISVSRRGKSSGPIDVALAALALRRQVKLVMPTPSAALFALQSSDLLMTTPEHTARSAINAGLKIRAFKLPVMLDSVLVTQAWHPRFQADPAHQWLRRTVWRLCNEPDADSEPAPVLLS